MSIVFRHPNALDQPEDWLCQSSRTCLFFGQDGLRVHPLPASFDGRAGEGKDDRSDKRTLLLVATRAKCPVDLHEL
jgi:hypothetical protein